MDYTNFLRSIRPVLASRHRILRLGEPVTGRIRSDPRIFMALPESEGCNVCHTQRLCLGWGKLLGIPTLRRLSNAGHSTLLGGTI